MKATLKKIKFLPVFFVCLYFAACQNGLSGPYKLSKVQSVFVINPTEEDKPDDDKWIKISPDAAEDFTSDRIAQTPVCEFKYPENTIARAATDGEIPVKEYKVGQKKSFKTHYKASKVETFTCVYESEHAYVWLRNSEAASKKMTEEEYTTFSAKFDKIYEQEIALCGPKFAGNLSDLSLTYPNKKISIVFYDIDEDGMGTYGGFYSSSDMYDRNVNGTSVTGIECIHIDSCYAKKSSTTGYSISSLSHEFNHKLNYDNKYFKYGLSCESWYTEMLSMLVEDFFYEDFGIGRLDSSQSRLGTFVSTHSQGFKYWKTEETAISGFYANAYAFGAYLARNFGGAELVHEMCTNEYTNEESVVNAVNKINGTNYTFSDLLEKFPYIMINNDNDYPELPSLNREWQGTLPELPDYVFVLHNIDYKEINETDLKDSSYKFTIRADDKSLINNLDLDSYGFLYFSYDTPTDVTIYAKDGLKVTGI